MQESTSTIKDLTGDQPIMLQLEPGASIGDVVRATGLPQEYWDKLVIMNHGMPIAQQFWDGYQTRDGDNITISVAVDGNGFKQILSLVASIAFSYFGAPWLASSMGFTGTALKIATAVISTVGSLIISALIPPPKLSFNNKTESQTYSLSGQSNSSSKYGIVPRIYGKHKFFPLINTNPLVTSIGKQSRVTAMYDFGLGDLDITEIKVGDSPIDSIDPEYTLHQDSLLTDPAYLYKRVGYDQYQYLLSKDGSVTVRTKTNCKSFDFDITFQALTTYNKGGSPTNRTVGFQLEYAPAGTAAFTPITADRVVGVDAVNGTIGAFTVVNITAATTQQIVANVQVDAPTAGQWDIRVTRRTDDSTVTSIVDKGYLTTLRSYQDGVIFNLRHKHTALEMRFVSSDKVSGVVQNLSAVAHSRLRWHDGVTWQPPILTSNPAWICLDILTSEANPSPLQDSQIDFSSWVALAAFCDQVVSTTVNGVTTTGPRFESNFVVDFETTVQELINSVLSACRSQLNISANGKYGVLIDDQQTLVRQVFTPKNSWGFHGERTFNEKVHAFRTKYVDPNANWQQTEVIVYNDGYTSANATKFEELESFGITNYAQAWRYGRYMLAQAVFRRERFVINVDVESLAIQRGELVEVQHDVPMVGGTSARVARVAGAFVTLTETLSTAPTNYLIRLNNGTVRQGLVVSVVSGNQMQLDNAAGLSSGDLIILGQANMVSGTYIVQEINPLEDFKAQLVLTTYNDGVYTADALPIPDYNPNFGQELINTTDLRVITLDASYELKYIARYPYANVFLQWTTLGTDYARAKVYAKYPGQEPVLLGETTDKTFSYQIDCVKEPEKLGLVEYEVVPYTSTGVEGTSAFDDLLIEGDNQPPLAPDFFGVNIQKEEAHVFWRLNREDDIDYYVIRYSTRVTGAEWNESQELAKVNHFTSFVHVGGRIGTYMIRAYDTSGNEGAIAYRRTSIDLMPDINVVTTVNEFPLWPGIVTNLDKVDPVFMVHWVPSMSVINPIGWTGGYLMSTGNFGSVVEEGVYSVETIVDIGQVHTARVSSKLLGYGLTEADLIANGGTLVNWFPQNSTSTSDKFDYWLEVSTADYVDVIANWTLLSPLPNLLGVVGDWTDWKPCYVGDFTGRLFRFQIQVRSYSVDVKAVITDGLIEVDMPDRVWSSEDVIVPAAGMWINFSPEFMVPPAVTVNVDGNNNQLFPEVTLKSRTRFFVRVLNSAGVSVGGQVDVVAKGYGRTALTAI